MSEVIIFVLVAIIAVAAGLTVKRLRPKKLNVERYTARWQAIQKNCANKKTWPTAVVEADELLDEVLKKRKYKGKTTGERLVRAQHDLKNNESVWFGHKLCNRIKQEDLKKISKHDTLESLSGFRQALKDLGALREKVILPTQESPVAEPVVVVPGEVVADADTTSAVPSKKASSKKAGSAKPKPKSRPRKIPS